MTNATQRALCALAIGCAVASTAACATVTRGVHQAWTVETVPSGAKVATTNGFSCEQTPCTFSMRRKAVFDVTITKDGYRTWTGSVTHAMSKGGGVGLAGNVIIGGAIGVGVDFGTGAVMDLKPNPLKVVLEKLDAAPAPVAPAAPVPATPATPAATPQ